jgi:hypothetical protein
MYKHWEKIALAIAAFFWNGCSDNSSSSDVKYACSFKGGACPDYGIDFYYCENPEDYHSPDMDKKCTFTPHDPCSDYYECEDGATCVKYDNETTMSCTDAQGNQITQDEIEKKYYTENRY